MKKLIKITSLLMVLALTFSIAGCKKKESVNVVATVNGQEISKQELDSYVNKMTELYKQQGAEFESAQGKEMLKYLQSQILDKLIEEKVISQEAEKQKLMPSDAEVDKEVKDAQAKFGSKEEFDKALKSFNWTVDVYKDKIRFSKGKEKLQEKVTKDITVSDQELQKYYDDNKDQYADPEMVRARHILIKFDTENTAEGQKVNRTEAQAKQIAEDLIKQLQNGADFATLAKEKTDDTGSKANGGEYTFKRGQMVPEFENAAFSLKPGEITKEPVKVVASNYAGFHIIKLEEKIPAKQKSFDEVKEQIKQKLLTDKKDEKFNQYVADLVKKAKVDRKLPKVDPPASMGGAQQPAGQP